MESPCCEQKTVKISLAEILRCFEHPISEEQAWAICFQCCCRMKELAQGLYPSLHSVFIKGPGSIFIHADGTISFRVYHKSDAGSIQQSEDKLLEYLGVVIYEALDWGIDSQVERELSDPLDRLLCLMLKLDDEGMKPTVTLQDVIKACEDHLSVPSEATSHYKMTCRSLFTEFMELQKLVSIIQSAKECLKKMDEEDLLETHMQKKEKQWASPWPSIICELQNGVKLRKAAERPQHPVPLKERTYSPYELLLDDIRHKRYKLRKVVIEQKCRTLSNAVAAPKPHLKPVLEWKLKDCVPREPTLHKQLMAEIKQPQKLQPSSVLESSRGPKEMSVIPNVALKKSLNDSLTSQDAHAAFQIVNTMAQRARSGVQEVTPKLPSSTQLASARSSVASYNSTGLAADHTLPPMSTPMLGDLQPNGFLNAGQQQLHPCRGRSKSLDTGLQSKELDCYFPTTKQSPTIAELIGTRYAMIMLQREGCCQGGSDGVFPRGKICFSCHKQMFLEWPYSCYLCSRLSREDDPAIQERKSSELLHEIEQWKCCSVPVILEPRSLAQPLCCRTQTMANWLTADICAHCECYLLSVASNQQQNIPLRRISQSWTKLE